MSQAIQEFTLFDLPPIFDGDSYFPEYDEKRLTGQLLAVYSLMRDGRFRTLSEIARAIGGSEAGVSARLRDLRKARWGGHTVTRRRVATGRGTHEYMLVLK